MKKLIEITRQEQEVYCDICGKRANEWGGSDSYREIRYEDIAYDVHNVCLGRLVFNHLNPPTT